VIAVFVIYTTNIKIEVELVKKFIIFAQGYSSGYGYGYGSGYGNSSRKSKSLLRNDERNLILIRVFGFVFAIGFTPLVRLACCA
jgi:hypothetical protein